MFGSMKKAMAVAAVVAVGAMAPAMASADTWSVGGASYAGPAQLQGTLTVTQSNGWGLSSCPVVAKVDLDNGAAGGAARGQLREYLLGTPTGYGSCSTSLPNCKPSFTVSTSPSWPISTSGQSVTVSGIVYGITYSSTGGGTCALAGVSLGVTGSMTGSVAGGTNQIAFGNSPGLTTSFGTAKTSGTLAAYAEDASGNADLTKPITLRP